MKYLALSSPSPPLYFLAQTSWGRKSRGEKKKQVKDGREPTVCFLDMIIWMLLSRVGWVRKRQHELVEVRIARFPLRGRGWHTQRWNMGFDLCSLDVVRRMGSGAGWYVSDQSGRVADWWWSGTVRHLACINGQTSTGRRAQYMHAFMTEWEMHGHRASSSSVFFLAGGICMKQLTYAQGDPDNRIWIHRYVCLSLSVCLCGTWMGHIYWHQGCPTCRPIIFLLSKGLHTICECAGAIKWTGFCPQCQTVKVLWVWNCDFLCMRVGMHSLCMCNLLQHGYFSSLYWCM